jgi:hypothetical protein
MAAKKTSDAPDPPKSTEVEKPADTEPTDKGETSGTSSSADASSGDVPTKGAETGDDAKSAKNAAGPTPDAKPAKARSEKPKKAEKPSAKAFILDQPLDKTPKEIVELGKAAGIVFKANYVSTERSKAKAAAKGPETKGAKKKGAKKTAVKKVPAKKQPVKKTSAKKVAAKKPSKAGAKKGAKRGIPPEKADFIKKQPRDMSAKEVVAEAKKHRISLSETYVYNVRRDAGITGHKTAKTAGKATKKSSKGRPSTQDEQAFRRLVIKVTVRRARELVEQVFEDYGED